jgi:AraC-like DNA-binding protein
MYLELSLFTIIEILSFTFALMLALLFVFSAQNNKKANLYLGLFLLSLSVEVLLGLSESIEYVELLLPQTALFTLPFLFFYIHQSINKRIEPWHYLLFFPGLLVNGCVFFFHQYFLPVFIEYIFGVIVLIIVLKVLAQHSKKVDNFYSDLENKTLHWIKLIVYIYFGFYFFWILEDLVTIQHENIVVYFAQTSTVLTFFMVLWIGHKGFSQNEIFMRDHLFDPNGFSDLKKARTIAGDFSTKDKMRFKKMCEEIGKRRLFTDPKLNLRILSQSLKLNEKEVSRLINQHTNNNFYQFINQFRVDEFKVLLASPKARQLSISGLAEEAGFNSKSTFYTAFKALEGITPKQYELSLNGSIRTF